MTRTENKRRRGGKFAIVALALILLLVGGAVVYAMGMKPGRGSTPKIVNRPTEARQVRPLSEKPDKRFAPLPVEPERHDQ